MSVTAIQDFSSVGALPHIHSKYQLIWQTNPYEIVFGRDRIHDILLVKHIANYSSNKQHRKILFFVNVKFKTKYVIILQKLSTPRTSVKNANRMISMKLRFNFILGSKCLVLVVGCKLARCHGKAMSCTNPDFNLIVGSDLTLCQYPDVRIFSVIDSGNGTIGSNS